MDARATPAESVEPENDRKGDGFPWYAWVLAFVLLVYPLSIGPAAKLHRAYPSARPTIEAVYTPVLVVIDHFPPAQTFFRWYVESVWRVN